MRENTSSIAMGFMQHFLKKVHTITDAIQECNFNTSIEATQSINIIEQKISDEFKQQRRIMT